MDFQEKKEFRFFKMIPWIVLGIVGAAALALLFGLILMLLWNWIMPEIFGLPEVTYWQAWGLVLLAHILFKGPMGHHDSHHREDERHREYWHRKFRDRFEHPSSHGSVHRKQTGTSGEDTTGGNDRTTEDDKPTEQQASDQQNTNRQEGKS